MKAYQLKITIKDSKPPIWRRCIVPAGITFSQLSILLNEVMGWSGYHLFAYDFYHLDLMIEEDPEFMFGDKEVLDATNTLIDEYLDDEEWFTYIYDFGDNWRHRVDVEEVISNHPENYSKVLKYQGDSPMEDSGGIDGYYEMLDILKDPSHPDYEEIKRWANMNSTGEYDMEYVNDILEHGFYAKFGMIDTRASSDIYAAIYDREEEGIITTKYKKEASGKNLSKGSNEATSVFSNSDKIDDIEEELLSLIKFYNETNAYEYVPQKLQDLLLSNYTRDELYEIAKLHQLPRRSTYNKTQLVKALSEYMLRKDIMEDFFIIADDDEMQSFEEVLKEAYINPLEMNNIEAIIDMEYKYNFVLSGGYICVDDDVFVAPTDVIDAYKLINTKEYHKKRKKTSKMIKYFNAASDLYGVAPLEIVLKMYNKNEKIKISLEQLVNIAENLPLNRLDFDFVGNKLIHKRYLEKEWFKELEKAQENLEFYLPSSQEVDSYHKFGIGPMDDFVYNLIHFLLEECEALEMDAINAVETLQRYIRHGGDLERFPVILTKYNITIRNNSQKNKMIPILSDFDYNTRKVINRGFTDQEIEKMKKKF